MNALGMKTYIHCSCSTHTLWRRHRSFKHNCELKKQTGFEKDRKKPIEFIEIACRALLCACKDESAEQSINIRLKTHINTVGVNWTKKMEVGRFTVFALSHVVMALSSFFISFFFSRIRNDNALWWTTATVLPSWPCPLFTSLVVHISMITMLCAVWYSKQRVWYAKGATVMVYKRINEWQTKQQRHVKIFFLFSNRCQFNRSTSKNLQFFTWCVMTASATVPGDGRQRCVNTSNARHMSSLWDWQQHSLRTPVQMVRVSVRQKNAINIRRIRIKNK